MARNFIKLLNKKYRQPDCLPACLPGCIFILCVSEKFVIGFWYSVHQFYCSRGNEALVHWCAHCTIHWWASECFPTITHFVIGVSLCVLTFAFDWHCTHAQKSIFNGVIKWQASRHSHAVQRITMRQQSWCAKPIVILESNEFPLSSSSSPSNRLTWTEFHYVLWAI